jgi:HAD-superfamily hydrolase, subfamily IIB
MLALDMDGTSLNREGQLAEDSIRALGEARRLGWTICFVTGRTRVDIAPLGDTWRVAQYLILNNGGKTIRAADDALVGRYLVDPADAEKTINHCIINKLQLYVLGDDAWWLNVVTPRDRQYIAHTGSEPILLRDVSQVPLDKVEGFMSLRDWSAVWEWVEKSGTGLEVFNSEPECVDILPSGVTKWNALLALADSLGAKPENIIAMGNYHNDLDMIQGAGVGIAVPSAPDEIKHIANYVTTKDYDDGAVSEVVARYVLPDSTGR